MVATTLAVPAQTPATRAAQNTDNLPGWKKLKLRLMAAKAATSPASGTAQQDAAPLASDDADADTDGDFEGDEGLCFCVEKIREMRARKEKDAMM
ncbi:hypothetical protein HDU83_008267 [Entophlyctis luteolus]|nr:hypothetical protein HDU82_000397 [Entophlyctis luteolus]KAJ3352216.1 hypothetical protein HDU83_008267 [Entophlyctis luteolus]KAJ3387498.1 hypothetical protein HDU84_000749 [Entophlyctis sp. JEL0112]